MVSSFQEHVYLPYQLYNSLFLTLPFEGVHKAGPLLPLLAQDCADGFREGLSPRIIIEQFFRERLTDLPEEQRMPLLFNIIQYVERQIVLFDAVEDAAYEHIYDLEGKGTLNALFDRVHTRQRADLLAQKLQDFYLRIVLTAHPTQFYPGPVLGIITDLEEAIRQKDMAGVNELLLQLGKTPFINREKPTPYDEAANLTWYLENVFYEAIPRVLRKLENMLQETGHALPVQPLISMGFWPGGDRDGNPFVDADTTLRVADRLRRTVLLSHYRQLRKLRRRITFRGVAEPLATIERRVYASLYGGENPYALPSDLVRDLQAVREQVVQQHSGLFVTHIDDLLLRIRLFGFHFATLDIRQDSRQHRAVWEEIINRHGKQLGIPADFYGLPDAEQWQLLTTLTGTITPHEMESAIGKDVIGSLFAMRQLQTQNGERATHRYIISNCGSVTDILLVYALARLTGWETPTIDIVPLFETVDDLQEAGATMQHLYTLPVYRQHLERRGMRQTIMLGFSDGTKDGGYVTANWSIFRAKEVLTGMSREQGVSVIFFDGRGGPPARGGGNTHNFYASLGSHIEDKAIEITVQGQTISSLFGNLPAAQYNLEQWLTAGLENDVFRGDIPDLTDADRQLLDELSTASHAAYLNLKHDPLFVPYLEEMTTLPYYGETNIGSRPVKRKKADQLKLEDLRAIPFVGSWSQMKQNVPGFYGFGAALRQLEEAGRLSEAINLYKQSLFFRTLVGNSLMALKKTYFPLTAYLKHHKKYGDFWQRIHAEYESSYRLLLAVSGQSTLMADNPVIRQSVDLRESIVLPLITIQQYALQTLAEEGSVLDEALQQQLRKMVLRSMFGNINATRNAA